MRTSKLRQAVILAGGKGTRLLPLTLTTPKPMVSIHGKPFLSYIIDILKKNGIKEIVLLTGYLPEKFEKYFGDGRRQGVKVTYSHSPIEADTGTRIKNVQRLLDDEFILLYGDNYWPLHLLQLYAYYKSSGLPAAVTVFSNFDKSTKNNMRINDHGIIEAYDRSRNSSLLNCVDIGFFILRKNLINSIREKEFSFEDSIVTDLVKKRNLAGFLTHHKYYGLSTLERIPAIKKYFKQKKVVFLDRDGVINKKAPKAKYITSWNEFIFLPKVKEAMKILQKKGYKIFIVSNQAGIARGIVTKRRIQQINARLRTELSSQGVIIRGIYICPHGWDEGCFCRKPNPGLFFKAAAYHHINLYESYCIGDDQRDIIAGKNAGCKTYLLTPQKSLYDIVQKYL